MTETLTQAPDQLSPEITAEHYQQYLDSIESKLPENVSEAVGQSAGASELASSILQLGDKYYIAGGSELDSDTANALLARREQVMDAYRLSDDERIRWAGYAKGGPKAEADEAQRNKDVSEYTRHKFPADANGERATEPAYSSFESYAAKKLRLDDSVKRFQEQGTGKISSRTSNESGGKNSSNPSYPSARTKKSEIADVSMDASNNDAGMDEKQQARAKHLQKIEQRAELMKRISHERFEQNTGNPNVDPEALKQQWAAEDAAGEQSIAQEATNGRVAAILAAKKFKMGSRAVERSGIESELYKEALIQAQDEGYSIEHLVDTVKDAPDTYQGKHRREATRPEGVPSAVWSTLSQEERQRAIEEDSRANADEQKLADEKTTGDPELDAELDKLGLLGEKEAADAEIATLPVTDVTAAGLETRRKNMLGRAADWIRKNRNKLVGTAVGASASRNEDLEHETNYRKRNIAIVVGAVAAAGAAVVAWKLGASNGGGSHHSVSHQILNGTMNSHSPHESLNASQPHFATTLSLTHHGDTMEGQIRNYLQAHGYAHDESTLLKVTDATLKANHETWPQAHGNPVGYHFGIPQEVLEGIAKTKS